MSDLIKREDAIEAIQDTYCKPCKEQGNDYSEAKCNFDDAILEIRDVPSVEAIPCEVADKVGEENERLTDRIGQLEEQMRWIPCSERLPSEKEFVLASVTAQDRNYDIVIMKGTDVKRYSEWVSAWHPLPTTYKESEVDE